MIMFFDTYDIDDKRKIYNSMEGVITKVGQEHTFDERFGETRFNTK
jgi:hypothetical protein